jgi:hypothetical protein
MQYVHVCWTANGLPWRDAKQQTETRIAAWLYVATHCCPFRGADTKSCREQTEIK